MANGLGYTEGSPAKIATEKVDVADGSQDQQIVQVWEKLVESNTNPTISTSAYVSGYAVGGLITIANASRAAAGGCRVETISVVDLAQQKAAIDFLFFRDTISGTTDHAAFDPSDADLAKFRGGVSLLGSDYADFNDNSAASLFDIGLVIPSLVATSVYCVPVVRGTPTYAAATDLRFVITVARL